MMFTSCKSSESAYKKAYLKAKEQEAAQQQTQDNDVPVVTPVQTTTQPVQTTTVTDNYANEHVRTEAVSMVSGAGLKAYSVVVGSFSVVANAEGLQQRLKAAGYNAQIVKNERNFYRVIAATFDNKADAVQIKQAIMGTQFNPDRDAWLLAR